MFISHSNDGSIYFSGDAKNTLKFLIGFCDVDAGSLCTTDLNTIGEVWSDIYGTIYICEG